MRRVYQITFFGVTVPVHRWTIACFSVLAVIGVSAVIYKQVAPPPDLVSLRQANSQLQTEIDEYGRHLGEPAEQAFADPDGELRVQVYRDHCVLIQRRGTAGVLTRLVPDLTRSGTVPQAASLFPVALAAGQCLNPHPGAFTQTFGEKDGCWVEVTRAWPDGCVHVQLLNACTGAWDSNGDGSPRVRWIRCVH